MFPPWNARRCEIDLARRESRLADFLSIDICGGEGVEVIQRERDFSSSPFARNFDLALIPRSADASEPLSFPARICKDGLRILLEIIGNARPAPRHLEIAPRFGGNRLGICVGRLPLPQTIDANSLARGRRLAECLVQIPDCFYIGGQLRRRLRK